ncbi:MAG: aa3-type cytochrome c oxidase subunit IV [Alphaproteobacteria bacterium]|nr:aa3-type cytochrome c oxidase subunit IV [Alphaproteobacteria bacterium]MBE8220326.1 aa3-type cytochrome c oxidase subunit IV [Alphaproteobacteria bacterium]
MARGEHESTYSLFLGLTKWAAIACAAILLFLLVVVYQ